MTASVLALAGCGIWIGDAEWAAWRDLSCEDTAAPVEASDCSEDGMVRVPAGTWTIGSPEDEIGRSEDELAHEVTLTGAFCIDATEVTQDAWKGLMVDDPTAFENCDGDCALDNVSWHMAALYANARSDAAGLERCYACAEGDVGTECVPALDPYECAGYRLPTEAEWEVAARGGLDGASFSHCGRLVAGTEESCDGDLALDHGGLLDEVALYCGNGANTPHPVTTLPPNGFGIYGMSGNLAEWCHDAYEDYVGPQTDPIGSLTSTLRVYRGGGWDSTPADVRVAKRFSDTAYRQQPDRGFRLARSD